MVDGDGKSWGGEEEEESACGEAAGRDGGLAEEEPWAERGMREEGRESRDLRGRV